MRNCSSVQILKVSVATCISNLHEICPLGPHESSHNEAHVSFYYFFIIIMYPVCCMLALPAGGNSSSYKEKFNCIEVYEKLVHTWFFYHFGPHEFLIHIMF